MKKPPLIFYVVKEGKTDACLGKGKVFNKMKDADAFFYACPNHALLWRIVDNKDGTRHSLELSRGK